MDETLQLVILFLLGILAAFMNVMAGGGSTITVPALIFMGLDSALANGTNRLAIISQNIFAVASFRRLEFHDFKESFRLSLLTLPGSVIGAIVAVKISDDWFQRILGIVLIGIVAAMLFQKNSISAEPSEMSKKKWILYPMMFGIGFYGGFIQAGVGFLLMGALFYIQKLDLVRVNMHKVFIALIFTIPAMAIFIWTGNVAWKLGLVLAAGNAVGGWWSAHVAVKKGEEVIRYVLAAAIIIMALKLLGVF